MEIVIVVCLLIVIALLLQDKIVIKRKSEQKPKQDPKLPDIMGQPKPVRSQSLPNTANESQIAEPEVDIDNLDIEYDTNENVGIQQIPQEELDEVFSNNVPDLAEEEEDLNRYRTSGSDDGFAQGVTFEELNSVGVLLQKETLEPAQKETAIDIVQRLQGTELFALLESSMQGASKKIAELLDSTLSSSDTEAGSSNLRKSDLSDFDIGEFV
ncbi:conjugal transfer protein TraD [Pedobacter chinensis]|uniref:Conjugal transfer protein TraD n=1 Tax=Pedobacter chinensis TaxID=2282421 RepID=A0A369PZZ9_9SPHI|nr:conjugal transfer protein TraD [Pedobacter chinensis]RDC58074.1 conjugal transfer protein TraD [Pedobacter chinensis]